MRLYDQTYPALRFENLSPHRNKKAQTHAGRDDLHKIGDCPDLRDGFFGFIYGPGWRPR
jgi:hypothetical protein